jgi:ADP-ribose pyrophosphatase YjhB (NUDIX family)
METRERLAARTLVLTPERRVLLMRFRSPWRGADIWITPGGSLKCEEDARDAARRKLREETGFQLNHVGPELWTRDHDLSSHGVPILQRERYFLVQVEEFVPWADSLEVGEEKDWFRGFRWWPLDELPDVAEEFAPRRLGALVRELLRTGPPEKLFAIPV